MALTRHLRIEVPLCCEVLWKATCFRNRMLLIFNSTLLRVPSCPNARSHLCIHVVHTIKYVSSHCDPRSVHHNLFAPDSRFVCSFLSARRKLTRSSATMMQRARARSVRRDFAPRPVSSHKGLPTDDVVPCLLRPICFSAISVAAIARSFLSLSSLPPFVVCAPARSRSRNGRRRVCMRLCAELAQLSLRRN